MARMEKLGAAGGPGRHPTPTFKQVNSQERLPGGGVTSQRWSQPEEGVKAETAPWGRRQLDLWTFEWRGRGGWPPRCFRSAYLCAGAPTCRSGQWRALVGF